MKQMLVTGGAGFIGSNFVRYILTKVPDLNVINLDALTYAGRMENLEDILEHPRHHFVQGDICNQDLVQRLLEDNKIDTIVHFAAESHVDRSILGPGQFIQTNVVGTFSMLECARKHWLVDQQFSVDQVRFHHVSTDEVFGSLSLEDPPFSDQTPYAPRSPYSASKAASDHLVQAYFHTYGLPITISNCTNNYGPYQFPEKLIPLIIINAVNGKPLPVYGDGKQIRDWLYVIDHCEAIFSILLEGKVGETYLIGGNNQPTNLEIIEEICSILDRILPVSSNVPHKQFIQYVVDRPGHDRRYAMDIRKIKQQLGWKPRESLLSGLRNTVQWYLDHPEWVQSVSGRSDFQLWMKQNYQNRKEV